MDRYFSYIHILNTAAMKPFLLTVVLLANLCIQAQPTAHLGLALAEVTATEKVYNVYVREYRGIIAHSYSMSFDEAKMTYQGIRNSIISSLNGSSFANPSAGVITSLWFEGSLVGEDYLDSTVLYQIVFNVVQPGGSNLCFSQTPLPFEFVDAESNSLDEIIIHDDCFDSLLVIINPSSVVAAVPGPKALIENIQVSGDGRFSFTSLQDQHLVFSLYDTQGRKLSTLTSTFYPKGRHQGDLRKALVPGAYLIQSMATGSSTFSQIVMVH